METTSRTAMVTGASAGIGEAFARRLAKDGWSLVLAARRRDRLETLAAELSRQHGVSADALVADLVSPEGRAVAEDRLRKGDVGLLINNAGFGSVGEFHALPIEREMEQIELNVLALVRLTHAALGAMVAEGKGGIINVASMAAFQPIPYNATYAATKAFVLHLSEAVHEEAKRHGVTVTAVCPGPVHTEFQEVAGIDPSRVRGAFWQEPEQVIDGALAANSAGRAVCVPGPINALTASSVRLAPRFLVRKIAGGVFRNVVRP